MELQLSDTLKGKVLLLLTGLACWSIPLQAQRKMPAWLQSETDSAYIEDYTEDITFRVFGSRKYTKYDIVDSKKKKDILYRPNSNFNIGVGVNYKFIGLNLGFNLPFINRDNDRYGKTRYLDLQSHIYLRKLVIDFYAQRYKGYYISNPESVFGKHDTRGPYPQRPDLYNLDLGLNVQYIFNDKRFSYRAAYLQNEYQKKSAGSFMVGGEILGVKIKGDSSFIPNQIVDTTFLRETHFYRTRIVGLAGNVGYAHTFVYKKHFFLTLSISGGLGVNHSKLWLDDGSIQREVGWQFNKTVRASVGYNSSRYFAGIHYVDMSASSEMPIPRTYQTFGTGNFRVSLVRRFALKKPLF